MPAASKVVKLPTRKAAAPKPAARRAPAKKAQTRTLAQAQHAHRDKTEGFAVGLSKAHYWWLTATADALGTSRQAVLTNILNRLVQRATLGGTKARRKAAA